MIDFTLGNLAALVGIAITMGGLVIAWIKWQLSGDFAKTSDVRELGGQVRALNSRVETLDRQVGTLPTQSDLRAISDRVGGLEREVGIAGAKIDGIRDSVGRVEQGMHMLVQHHLQAEA